MEPGAGPSVATSAEGGVTEVTSPSALTSTEDLPIAPVYGSACGCKRCRPCGFYDAFRSCRGEK